MQLAQRGDADAAARHVDDPLERQIVVALVDHPQVRDGVAHLLALVEPRTPDHPVGDAERDQPFLELAGLKRSEEHTSELQSLMRISYAVFCLKKKKNNIQNTTKDIKTHIQNMNT